MKTLLATLAVLTVTLLANAQTYNQDTNHTRIGFISTHFGISHVEGHFKEVTATLISKKDDLSDAVIALTAVVKSIDTDNDMRDKDLKSEDWLDEARYTTIMFKSTSFKKTSDKVYKLIGEITIRGITKPISFDVAFGKTFSPLNKKYVAGFTITGKLNRQDFKVGLDTPAALVSDDISLIANVEFSID